MIATVRAVMVSVVLVATAVGQAVMAAELVAEAAALRASTSSESALHGQALIVATERYRAFARKLRALPPGTDHVAITCAMEHWWYGAARLSSLEDDQRDLLTNMGERFAGEPEDPAGRAWVLHWRTRVAFDLQDAASMVEPWLKLFAEHPDGPRKVWIAVAVARDLLLLCNALAEAELVLDEALRDLQSMPAWSDDECQLFCIDRDIWITRPERVGAGSKDDALGQVLLLRGLARIRLGRPIAGIADLETARSPFERVGNDHRSANIGHNLAFARLQLGDFVGALEVAKRTEAAYVQATWNGDDGPDRNGVRAMRWVHARVLLDSGVRADEQEAIALLRQILSDIGVPSRSETNGAALFALINALLRQPATEERDQELAVRFAEADLMATWGPEAAAERDILLARFHLQNDRLLMTRMAAADAVGRSEGRSNPRLLVGGLLLLAEVERRTENYVAAMDLYSRAADEMAGFVLDQQIWRLQGSVPELLRSFDEILAGALAVYRATAAAGDLRKFYELMQRFHGFESWCWLLYRDRSVVADDQNTPEVRRLRQSRKERAALLREVRSLDAQPARDPRSLYHQIQKRRKNTAAVKGLDVVIADLQGRLGQALPAAVMQPPTLPQIQASLASGEVLIQCVALSHEAFAFVVTKSSISLGDLPHDDAWRKALQDWQGWIHGDADEVDPTSVAPLLALSSQLLPQDGWLDQALAAAAGGQLLWSPSGSYCQVPIAALMVRGKPVCTDLAVVHVLSSGLMVRNRQASLAPGKGRPRRLLAFGNPRYPKAVVDGLVRRSMTAGGGFPQLSATPKEVVAVARLFASDAERKQLDSISKPAAIDGELLGERYRVLLGSAAQKAALTPEALAQASVLHFACHGCMDQAVPARSFLALSLNGDRQLGATDGLLRLADLCELRGNFELTVLSACETAAGVPRPHAPPMSLAWAARLAGARRVMAMGWKVEDERAGELVVEFYRQWLDAKLPPAQALHRVQSAAVGKVPVRDWAAMQLWGDAR